MEGRNPMKPRLHLTPTTRPWQGNPETAIALLMSGGVDSSVSAVLLRAAGWEVVGITMRIPRLASHGKGPCCVEDAATVASALDMPHYILDTESLFHEAIITPFRAAYLAGRTPNPCCLCNGELKFGLLWDAVEAQLGLTHLATGHYARVERRRGAARLCRAADPRRDQSYFIYRVPRRRVEHLHLPLGDLTKEAVRERARTAGLPVAGRPDSMDICFLGAGDYRHCFPDVPDRPGPILDTAGEVVGTHRGIWHYTVGQRRGLGVAAPEPLYVLRIDAAQNALVVGPRAAALRQAVGATDVNILQPERWQAGTALRGKLRSLAHLHPCVLDAAGPQGVTIRFAEPRFAPAPGQHLVLYDEDDSVVGGGAIA